MSLTGALLEQANSCEALGSPFTARLLRMTATNLRHGAPVADRLLGWPGALGPRAQSVPLRLAGSLHALVLDGTAPDLAACYPSHDVPDADLWQAVETALHTHEARLMRWLDSPPQTNEVGRSAVLIAAGHWLTERFGLPIILSELGASAGLNLFWNHYALALPDGARLGPDMSALTLSPEWTGSPPPKATPHIADRRGVDLTPLDPTNPEHQLRLRAYVWPDQADRAARLQAALSTALPRVDQGDAADWLDQRLAKPPPGHLHLVYHTIAWQYFPPTVQAKARAALEAAGAAATDAAPLAWLGMEADTKTPGAGLTLRLWPGDLRFSLGRADFHGRWVQWDPTALS